MMWLLCGILGIFTVAFAPLLITLIVKMLSAYARKYPSLTDAAAIITSIIIGAYLIAMSVVFAVIYHRLLTGH